MKFSDQCISQHKNDSHTLLDYTHCRSPLLAFRWWQLCNLIFRLKSLLCIFILNEQKALFKCNASFLTFYTNFSNLGCPFSLSPFLSFCQLLNMSGKEGNSMHLIILDTNFYPSHSTAERFFPLTLYIKYAKRNIKFQFRGLTSTLKKETPVYMAVLSLTSISTT